jgi:peroxiredoxin
VRDRISFDPTDERDRRVAESLPGIRHFWDFDGAISRAYGAMAADEQSTAAKMQYRRFWMVIDPTLRVRAVFPFEAGHGAVFAHLRAARARPVRRVRNPGPGHHAAGCVRARALQAPDRHL